MLVMLQALLRVALFASLGGLIGAPVGGLLGGASGVLVGYSSGAFAEGAFLGAWLGAVVGALMSPPEEGWLTPAGPRSPRWAAPRVERLATERAGRPDPGAFQQSVRAGDGELE
jgi:hypothetical protein